MLKKLTGPGLFRLVLAEVVFLYHISRFSVGTAAVYVFFCLSGFWVFRMYRDRYAKTKQPYLTFIASRMWRLMPAFWLVTAISLVYYYCNGSLRSYWQADGPLHFLFSNSLILGYDSLRAQPLVPSWSLDIEMQFYLIAPLLAMLLLWRRVSPLWVLLIAGGMSAASAFLGNPVPLLSGLVFFIFGMTAACADWKPSGKLVLCFLAATALGTAFVLLSPWRGILLVGANPGPLAVFTPHANVALALLFLPYAIYTTRQPGFGVDAICADLSYVVYLLHWPATKWLQVHPGTMLHRLWNAALAWAIVSLGAVLIWKFYDRPINRLRARWVKGRMKPRMEAPVSPISEVATERSQ